MFGTTALRIYTPCVYVLILPKLKRFSFPLAARRAVNTGPHYALSFVALGVIWTMFGHLAVLCLRSSEEVPTEIDTNCGDCTPPAAGASRRRLEDLLVSA